MPSISNRTKLIIGGVVLLGVIAILALIITNISTITDNVDDVLSFVFDPEARVGNVVQCEDSNTCKWVFPFVFAGGLIFVILTGFAYTTLLERKLISWFQDRVGPNRVGPEGFLQPAADGVKLIFKEDIIPDGVSKVVYYLAPMLKTIPVLLVVAVIPLGPDLLIPWFDGNWYQVPQGLADPNVGVLWVVGITSIATYGVVLAGWSSNNKYAMLGGLRASAQMISYELSLGLALAVPVMIAGSMSFGDIMNQQKHVWDWFVFQNPLAAGILLIALLAEVSRSPFDLTEAEQELTAGYMTEYSGMKFAMFMMAEYIGMIAVSLIAVAAYFGGYHLIPMDNLALFAPLVFIGKVVLMLMGMIWIRATLPRFRYDRLMMFGWKILLPLAILSVVWTAVAVVIGEEFGSAGYNIASIVIFLVVVIGGYLFLRDSGEDIEEDSLQDDPLITGERAGLGWALLQVLGGLIAIPFILIKWNIKLFDNLANAWNPQPKETSIEQSSSSVQTGGDLS